MLLYSTAIKEMSERTKIKFMAGFVVMFFTIGFGTIAVASLTPGSVVSVVIAATVNWIIIKLAVEELAYLDEQEK